MVEQVEEVQAELDCGLFMEEGPALVQRHVRVVEVWSSDEASRSHVARDRAKRISDQGERPGIDDCIAVTAGDGALSRHQRSQRRRKARLYKSTALVQLARIRRSGCRVDTKVVLVSALEDSEVVTILSRYDCCQLPSSQHAALQGIRSLQFRQEI